MKKLTATFSYDSTHFTKEYFDTEPSEIKGFSVKGYTAEDKFYYDLNGKFIDDGFGKLHNINFIEHVRKVIEEI